MIIVAEAADVVEVVLGGEFSGLLSLPCVVNNVGGGVKRQGGGGGPRAGLHQL